MAEEKTGKAAFLVGVGIFASRIAGLVRQSIFAHYFGNGAIASAFAMAFRIPNLLQNLFGEGVLSASFIPEYASLLADDNHEAASDVAVAVGAALALVSAIIVIVGVATAPLFVSLIASSYSPDIRALTTTLVRILFPGAGLLVCSAWCLGVLNSHRKFLLSYTAPLAWNAVMISALIWFGRRQSLDHLAVSLAWASVLGSGLQFAVQVPAVLRVTTHLRRRVQFNNPAAQRVFRNFLPAFTSRGVVQLSGYVDLIIAGACGEIAVSALTYAQTLYLLPGSLFGMAVSAAELPAMASVRGDVETTYALLRDRLNAGMARIAFYIIPSLVAFLALGNVIVALLFQSGRFKGADTTYVWAILAGSTVGLLASTLGRLDSSTYFALRDTRTPLRFAVVRILLTTVLGYLCAVPLPHLLGIDVKWGAVGLTASAGVAGWLEFILLRRGLTRKIGHTGLSVRYVVTLWTAALPAAAVAWGIERLLAPAGPRLVAFVVLPAYGLLYIAICTMLRVPEVTALTARIRRRVRR